MASDVIGETGGAGGRLVGPAAIAIRQHSWRGPLAQRGDVMALLASRFSIVNDSATARMVPAMTLDPLQAGSGLQEAGRLTIDAGASVAVAPGAAAVVVLDGAVPARPGVYHSAVRGLDPGSAIPITVTVPAAAAWGIGCMMLGLMLLGLINFLAGEGDVQSRLRDAL